MAGYPITLIPAGRTCLVVGGGAVAERKILKLLESGFVVKMVSPAATETLTRFGAGGKILWEARNYLPGDEEGAALVFVATSDRAVNAQVAHEAARRGILANVADDPEGGGFLLPAMHRDGDITLAVDTGGSSPALAAWLRDHLAAAIPQGAGEAARILGLIKRKGSAKPAREQYLAALEGGLCEKLAAGDLEGAAKTVDGAFGAGTWDKLIEGSD